jgi:hypothetical protein
MNLMSLLVALRMYSVQATLILSAISTYLLANPGMLDMMPKWVMPTITAVLGIASWIGRTVPQPEAAASLKTAQLK